MIKQLSNKIVYQNRWMVVCEDEVEFANGHRGIYGVVEKDDFALIVPFDGKHFHLVKQFRYATSHDSIEFPQGKHEDNPDEDPTRLAQDELQEELGLVAASMVEIGYLHEAPGYSNQAFHIFLATGLKHVGKQRDITEADLSHLKMTIEEFEQAVIDGLITDAPTVSAYGLLKMKRLI